MTKTLFLRIEFKENTDESVIDGIIDCLAQDEQVKKIERLLWEST